MSARGHGHGLRRRFAAAAYGFFHSGETSRIEAQGRMTGAGLEEIARFYEETVQIYKETAQVWKETARGWEEAAQAWKETSHAGEATAHAQEEDCRRQPRSQSRACTPGTTASHPVDGEEGWGDTHSESCRQQC